VAILSFPLREMLPAPPQASSVIFLFHFFLFFSDRALFVWPSCVMFLDGLGSGVNQIVGGPVPMVRKYRPVNWSNRQVYREVKIVCTV
jgi:hypothetical protein